MYFLSLFVYLICSIVPYIITVTHSHSTLAFQLTFGRPIFLRECGFYKISIALKLIGCFTLCIMSIQGSKSTILNIKDKKPKDDRTWYNFEMRNGITSSKENPHIIT